MAFMETRRRYVASPEAGGDSIDAAIGSAINDAEARVLAALRGEPFRGDDPYIAQAAKGGPDLTLAKRLEVRGHCRRCGGSDGWEHAPDCSDR